MKAVILAAGFSTRLFPLTKNFPKGLLKIKDKPIVSYVTEDLLRTKDITETVLISNDCFSHLFRNWINQEHKGKITVLNNRVTCLEKRLGAIGDLLFALHETGWNDDVLVTTSDTLSSLRMTDFISFYKKHNTIVTAIYKTNDINKIAGKLGCAVIKEDKLIDFIEKPETPPSLYMGVPFYIFPKKTLSLIKVYANEGNILDAPGSILSWFLTKESIYAFKVKGYYFDVGTVEVYKTLQTRFLTEKDH